MEKLQAALERARKQRDETHPSAGARPREATRAAQAANTAPLQLKDAPRPGHSASGQSASGKASQLTLDQLWHELPKLELPGNKALERASIVAHTPGPAAAPFDILRTKLSQLMQRQGWRRVAVTSATKGCGKTTTCANLLTGIARQDQMHAVLFDLDLRRPALAKIFGQKPQDNITSLLSGMVPFERQTMCLNGRGAVCATTSMVHDPAVYLGSPRTKAILDDIETRYQPDMMIFDLPPLLVSEDARAFLVNVDCVVIMAAAGETTPQQIARCEAEVAEVTNVAGVVLNRCRYMAPSESYYDYGD